jgi:hypothetical protein
MNSYYPYYLATIETKSQAHRMEWIVHARDFGEAAKAVNSHAVRVLSSGWTLLSLKVIGLVLIEGTDESL